jgi:hypothetical protein
MITRVKTMLCHVPVVIMALLLTACDSGPSDAEFVAACLKEGENVASKMLDKEMGVNREVTCKCAAKEARSSFSPDGYRAMILDMQGNKQEASAITSKMSEAEQLAVMKGTSDLFEKCVGGPK